MEGSAGGDQRQAVGNGPAGSRWNPTKEQINMLEGLYKQGLRTPSAEQIQQITSRLRAHGHIEGKNVFYWFQNHKARQRQKQKQESSSLAYFNRFAPVFPPYHHHHHHQNVVCSPCYIPPPPPPPPNNELGFYQQQYHQYHHHPKVPLPAAAAGFKRRSLTPPAENKKHPTSTGYNKTHHPTRSKDQHHHHHQETLDLFPMHPTGILQAKNAAAQENGGTDHQSKNPNSCEGPAGNHSDDDDDDDEHPFFDFFCGNN